VSALAAILSILAGAGTACRRARAIASFLASRPSSKRICTQIYEIGDWQHAVPLVPRVRAGVAP